MKTGKNGIELIKEIESCELHAYKCPAGKWTIGYGHTGNVYEGEIITQAQAENLLKSDLAIAENAVNRLVKAPLTQNQFDALVSFVFNVGAGANGFGGSTLLKMLNAKKYVDAGNQFARWNKKVKIDKKTGKSVIDPKTGKTVLEECEGLTRRRAAEKALFLTKEVAKC